METQTPARLPAPRTPLLRRDPSRKAVAGVAAGLAAHLGVRTGWVRAAFILLGFIDGLGVLLYALMWLLVPSGMPVAQAAGLETATRRGMRPEPHQRQSTPVDVGVIMSVGFVVAGILWLLVSGGLFIPSGYFWPLLLAGIGVVILWLQADRSSNSGSAVTDGSIWRRLTRGSGAASIARLIGGLLLVGLGSSWILASQIGLSELPSVLGASAALVGGLLIVAAPWLYRMRQRVRIEEQKRMRAEARSDMAAHLHDSVLQTLALIQRQADDSATVASLARRQERELRTWLYGEPTRSQTLKGSLEKIRADAEELFPEITVEVVCVGDMDVDDVTEPLVHAAREAVTNAGKHSGAARIDVYAEVEPDRVEVFVRDRGKGFDPATIGSDRQGVKESIRARMERSGGSARIRTAPGEGTEVKLEMIR